MSPPSPVALWLVAGALVLPARVEGFALAVDNPKPSGLASQTKAKPAKPARRENPLAFEQAMDQVRLLAAKFQQYRNVAAGARSLAVLASVVCKHDKLQAPVFFHQALELLQSRLQSEHDPVEQERLWNTHALVVGLGAGCDAELGERMNRGAKPASETAWSNLIAARSLLEIDPAKALQFA